jgi:5-methylcytosine-specific restriction endonuclease McrA
MTPDWKPAARHKASAQEWVGIRHAFMGESCWTCGRPYADLHHILSRGAGRGDDVPENLMPLCRECHRMVEDGDSLARARVRDALRAENVVYLYERLGSVWHGWLDTKYPAAA